MEYFIHEKAICESGTIGKGTRIWGFTHILPKAQIGEGCNIGEQVFIENHVSIGNGCTIKNGVSIWDCVTLEDDVFVGPNAVFTNDYRPRAFNKSGFENFSKTRIERGATIGANATIVCGVTIGRYAMVGAGSVVIRDVPEHTMVVGNPAKALYRICYCGQPFDKEDYCQSCQSTLSENQKFQ